MLNKSQWRAIYHFCELKHYDRPSDLLADLKAQGTVGRFDDIHSLADKPKSGSGKAMLNYLSGAIYD